MDYAILILECALHQNKFAVCHQQALPFEKVRRNDDVGNGGACSHADKSQPPFATLSI